MLPWNSAQGEALTYQAASGARTGGSPPVSLTVRTAMPAPFVESAGGKYFPIDQPNKYSLYRYSKAHGRIACQGCHQSIHGLYPVRYEGEKRTVDLTSHQQALQFSPDGKYAGPVTCAACHTVNQNGVPTLLKGTEYYGDYWASVALIHFMREGDQDLSTADLIKKFPYDTAKRIVMQGWK